MLEFLYSILVTTLGGVACHYIIKWLDGDKHETEVQPMGLSLPIAKIRNRKPRR